VNGIPNRVVRLVTLVSVAAVSILGSTQAMAAAPISKFSGVSNAKALGVNVDPSAVANINLDSLRAILQGLPLGTGVTVDGLVGGTLSNPTAPITLVANSAHSEGASLDGTTLASGTSTTTPLGLDATSLNQELALLKAALTKVPKGATDELNARLAPVISALGDTASLQAIQNDLSVIAGAVADTLGNPTANVFDSVTAQYLQDITNTNISADKSFLSTSAYTFGPYEARALKSSAAGPPDLAQNSLTNLNLLGTGNIGLPNLAQALADLNSKVPGIEAALTTTLNSLGLSAVNTLLGTVYPTVNAAATQIIGALDAGLSQLNSALNKLNVIDTLQLNDILSTTAPAVGLSTLARIGDTVNAFGQGNLAHVDLLRLNNPLLLSILQSLPGAGNLAGLNLLTVDGVKGTASTTLDGVNMPVYSGGGQLVDIKILGKNLSDLANGLSLDAILPPGFSCKIMIPGGTDCPGLPAVDTILGAVKGTPVDGLITITLTRGILLKAANSSPVYGKSSVVTLAANVSLNCGLLPAVPNVNLPVANISLCPAAPANLSATNAAAAPRAIGTGVRTLVDVQLGQADSMVNLSTTPPCAASDPSCSQASGTHIPNTGNNMLILAAFGLVLAAAGIAINRTRLPVRG
jgi:hypothetical protein